MIGVTKHGSFVNEKSVHPRRAHFKYYALLSCNVLKSATFTLWKEVKCYGELYETKKSIFVFYIESNGSIYIQIDLIYRALKCWKCWLVSFPVTSQFPAPREYVNIHQTNKKGTKKIEGMIHVFSKIQEKRLTAYTVGR